MAWRTWRGVLGGSLAVSLLVAPVVTARADPTPAAPAPSAVTNQGKSAAKPVARTATAAKPKPKPEKAAARRTLTHPVKQLAAAKKKPEPAKKIVVAKKTPEPAKSEPTKTASAEIKSAPASYTITSTRDGVTTTTTRIVPVATATTAAPVTAAALPSTPASSPAATKPAATVAAAPVDAKPTQGSAPAQVAAAPPAEPKVVAAPPKPAPFAAVAATAMAPAPAKPELAVAPAVIPSDPKTAAGFVSNFLAEAFHLAKFDGSSLQRRALLADLFASKMDVKRIAGYTTADELSGASSDIQQRFRTILVSYLVETYYPQLELASDPAVKVETVAAEPLSDGTAVVWTTFTKEGWGSQAVKWHLQEVDGHYRIVDIFSAGASLVQMERETFQSVMRNGGLNELMAKLDARTKQLATAATE